MPEGCNAVDGSARGGRLARLIFSSLLDRHAKRYGWLRAVLFRFEASIVLLLWWVFRALPIDRAARLGRFVVGGLGPQSAKVAIVKANLSIALPSLDAHAIDKLARRTWRNIGSVFGEYSALDRIVGDSRSRLEIVDGCGLETYRSRERAAVFVGAHLANWEIMAVALAREGVPLLGFYGPIQNPHFAMLIKRVRASLGYTMLAHRDAKPCRSNAIRPDRDDVASIVKRHSNDSK